MKTVYLIKTEPRLVQFECDPDLGLSFPGDLLKIQLCLNEWGRVGFKLKLSISFFNLVKIELRIDNS